jgi:hypothetical protein
MGRRLRRRALALTLFVFLPAVGSAAPFDALSVGFLNSNLTFGGPGFLHEGYDVYSVNFHGVNYMQEFDGTTFIASGGVLVQTTPIFDGGGQLIRTDYLYQGGTFTVDFEDFHSASAPTGLFTAPIVSLVVRAGEPLSPRASVGGDGSGVRAQYSLGAGAFDAALQNLLGIPQHTGPTTFGDADMRLLFGDHTSSELVADDGLMNLDVPAAAVPEPALTTLLALGVLSALQVRRRSRRT